MDNKPADRFEKVLRGNNLKWNLTVFYGDEASQAAIAFFNKLLADNGLRVAINIEFLDPSKEEKADGLKSK